MSTKEDKTKAEEAQKALLVNTAFEAGFGDKEFLSGLDIVNLEIIVNNIIEKNTEIAAYKAKLALKPKKSNGDDYSKVTTVADLVKNKRLKVSEKEVK